MTWKTASAALLLAVGAGAGLLFGLGGAGTVLPNGSTDSLDGVGAAPAPLARSVESPAQAADRPAASESAVDGGGTSDPRGATAGSGGPEGIRVRVLDADSNAPIEGAAVVLAVDSPAGHEAGLSLPTDVVASAATDAEGRCALGGAARPTAGRVVAKAPGHVAAEQAFSEPPTAEVVLRLGTGLSIEGHVRDVAGRPLPGVDLACAHEELPRVRGGAALPPRPGRDEATARSGDDGSFRLAGLSPGPYRVVVGTDGFALDQSVRGRPVRSPSGVDAVHAQAGDDEVEIRLVPIRWVAVRFVRRGADAPVSSSVVSAVLSGGGPFTTSVLSYGPRAGGGGPVSDGDDGNGTLRAAVLLEAGADAPARARVDVRAEGFAPGSAEVRLRMPSEIASGAAPDVVELDPADPSANATLLVDAPRDLAGLYRPEVRVLTACRSSDGRMTYVRGRRVDGGAGDRWRFDGLPAGDSWVQVYDGVSKSRFARATPSATEAAVVRVEFPAPTGATFVLKDADGARVFDADGLLVAPPERTTELPDRADATRLATAAGAGVLAVVVPLAPGEYRYATWKRGAGYAGGTFHVEAGQVARVTAVLKPRVRSDAAPTTAAAAERGK